MSGFAIEVLLLVSMSLTAPIGFCRAPAEPALAPATARFGPTGHRIVGRIAAAHLSPQAAAAVADLLGHQTLAQVATWPDEIRSDPKWKHSAPWHYVTIEDGQTYATSTKNPAGDAVAALRRFIAVLKDPKAAKGDRVIALKWVVHLVGDLHQPLHVGRGKDKGGNTIGVEWFGEKTNLHAVWDTGLIRSTRLSFSELAEFLDDASPQQVAQWQSATIDDWVEESLGYRARVYTPPGPSTADSYRYAYKNLPLVELRLKQAGVRLAGLLDKIYGGDSTWQGMPNGLHWQRNSAEYRALTRQTYASAKARLTFLQSIGALPAAGTWAVALDADETVLDNSLYQKEQKNHYDKTTWRRWVARREATAVPGAIDFLKHVRALGGRITIVSNRLVSMQADTEANLNKLGAPFDALLLRDKNPQKEPRWDRIQNGQVPGLPALEIVMYLGDNIEDFPNLDQSLRRKKPAAFADFGASYFILPNPVYGSWLGNPRK